MDPTTEIQTLVNCAQGIFHDTPQDRPASINTFKRTEILQSMFSYHDGIKLEIDKRKKFWEFTNM